MKKITQAIRMFLAAAIPVIAVILCICILTVRRQERRPVRLENNDPAVSKQQTEVQNNSSALSFLPASSVQENVSSDVAVNRPAPAELKPLAAVHYPQQDSSYSPRQSSNKTEPISRAFQTGYSRFAAKSASLLLKENKSEQNACYSPISLFMAASMLTECTAGESQKELLAMLGMNSTAHIRKEIPAYFRNNYFSNDYGSLVPANSVWVQKNANLKPDLFHRLAKDYYAETFTASFGQKETANRIGHWLKEHTGGKFIQAPKGADNPLTALMLINAIYFKNEWQDSFYADRNESGSFTPIPFLCAETPKCRLLSRTDIP